MLSVRLRRPARSTPRATSGGGCSRRAANVRPSISGPRAVRALWTAAALTAGCALVTAGPWLARPPSTARGTRRPVAAQHVAGASERPARSAAPYYVAVGASESLGYQPTAADPHGAPSDEGYADDVVDDEQRRWPGLDLVQFGCPGTTAVEALDGHSRCRYPSGSQIATAVRFLRAHRARTKLVTVDLGFNDVRLCLEHRRVDASCAQRALRRIDRALPRILGDLRAAAGAGTQIVGLQHDDPYWGVYLHGGAARRFAETSARVLRRLNAELAAIYTTSGDLVADVPAAFATTDTSQVALAGHGTVPAAVARACSLTWMCSAHNLHPDAAGYRLIASAVTAALDTAPLDTAPLAST